MTHKKNPANLYGRLKRVLALVLTLALVVGALQFPVQAGNEEDAYYPEVEQALYPEDSSATDGYEPQGDEDDSPPDEADYADEDCATDADEGADEEPAEGYTPVEEYPTEEENTAYTDTPDQVNDATAAPLHITPLAARDLTNYVTVTDWDLRVTITDPSDTSVFDMAAIPFSQGMNLHFTWEITDPPDGLIHAGDFFSIRLPRPMSEGYFRRSNSQWQPLASGDGVWRIYNNYIQIEFNDNADGSISISGNLHVGGIANNVTVGGVQNIRFANEDRPANFQQRSQTRPSLNTRTQTKDVSSRTNGRVVWFMELHDIGNRELSGQLGDFTEPPGPGRWGQHFTEVPGFYFEDTLNGRFAGITFTTRIHTPISLNPDSSDYGFATIGAAWTNNFTPRTTRVFPMADESYEDFRARLNPFQWGVWPAPLTASAAENIHPDVVQTVVAYFGTLGYSGPGTSTGLRYSQIAPNFASLAARESINRGWYTEDRYEELRDYFTRVYGNGGVSAVDGSPIPPNVIDGRISNIRVTLTEDLDLVTSEEGTRDVDNVMTVWRDGESANSYATATMEYTGGGNIIIPADRATITLRDQVTNALLSGATFQLQRQEAGVWVDVDGRIYTTGVNGTVTTRGIANGTYRFVQTGVGASALFPTAYYRLNNPAHNSFYLGIEVPVSASFVLSGGSQGASVTVYNVRTQHTVTFNLASGAYAGDSALLTQTIDHTQNATALTADPTRAGYRFTGWSPALNLTNVTEDRTFVAQWIAVYTVTFDLTGGAYAGDQDLLVQTVDHEADGSELSQNPTRTGYTFTGWEPVVDVLNVTEDRTFVAQWEIITYTVTFDLGGGVYAGDQDLLVQTVNHGADGSELSQNPTRTGYTFTGWEPVVDVLNVTEDRTFVAQWEIITYTITFDLAGGVYAGDQDLLVQTVNHGADGSELSENPTRTGYTFTGWEPVVDVLNVTQDRTFVAQWEIITYTITFDLDGGVYAGDQNLLVQTVNHGADGVELSQNPTRTGYTFTGWEPVVDVLNVTEDRTFVAQWEIITYTITFDLDGGVYADDQDLLVQTVDHGANATELTAEPTRASYRFTGWNPALNLTNVTENRTFVAQWVALFPITYEFTNTPTGAPAVPPARIEAAGSPQSATAISPLYFDGDNDGTPGRWTFSNWATTAVITGSPANFTMPNGPVHFTGSWAFTAHPSVIYIVPGDAPATFSPELSALGGTHAPGAPVTMAGDLTTTETTHPIYGLGQWQFNGWSTTDVPVADGQFTMPTGSVTFTGSWAFIPTASRTVIYVVPGDAPATFSPALDTLGGLYQIGAPVTVASGLTTDATTHPNGRIGTWTFDGWDRSGSFPMPEENVIITGAWTFTANYFYITYEFAGDIPLPAGAPVEPADRRKAEGTPDISPTTLLMPAMLLNRTAGLTVNGVRDGQPGTWTFEGWTTESNGANTTSFTMPGNDVEFVGHWTFEPQFVQPDYTLTLHKSSNPAPGSHVMVGDTVTYTITVTNTGTTASGSMVITDDIPQGMTLVAGSYTGDGVPSVNGQTLRWDIPPIAPGQTVTVSFDVTVDPLPAGVYRRTFVNTAIVNEVATNTVTLYTDGLVKNPDRTRLMVGEAINWTLRGFHNPTGRTVNNFSIADTPSVGLNFSHASIPAFYNAVYNGQNVTYNVRYRVAGSNAWHYHTTGVDATRPFSFSLPQPGNLYYTEIVLDFGTVPAGFGLGNHMVFTFVAGPAPGNVLTNMFFITYDEERIYGDSPDRPQLIPTPDLETPQQPLPPGTPLPGPVNPYAPWQPGEPVYVALPNNADGGDAVHHDTAPELIPVAPMPISPMHHAYMIGFHEDGTIRPQANITRAEVATIFFRLIADQHRANIWSQTNSFDDVAPARWFNNAVSTMENGGLFNGIPLGDTFAPNQAATRAEFAVMVVNYLGLGHYRVTGGHAFTDIDGHWASDAINVAFMQGWVSGFGDGTFRPDQLITRAEVAALINRALGRRPETEDDLLPGMITWPDNSNRNAWFFLYIQEATNSNYFEMKEDGVHKTWTGLFEPRNWRALERPYSTPW